MYSRNLHMEPGIFKNLQFETASFSVMKHKKETASKELNNIKKELSLETTNQY